MFYNKNNKKSELVNEFINNTKNFWREDKKFIDKKHLNIIRLFERKYKNNIKEYVEDLIDWEGQTNMGAPFQFNRHKIKHLGMLKLFRQFLQNYKSKSLTRYFNKVSFFDDLEIIKKNNGLHILKLFPAHKNSDFNDFYFINNKISSNNRWNRYIYLASQIKKKKILNNNHQNWLDIGSYYGGLQMIVKKFNKNNNFFLLDFNHQLCRSYVCLKLLYPKSEHILPNQINENLKIKKNAFYYIPVNKYNLLKKVKFDLITNFFSFGEMKRNFFNQYFNNSIMTKAKVIYLVNRFVSSPYFEPTYNNDLTIFDYYKKNFKTIYFDIFPIHYYKNIYRKVFRKLSYRPISSPYFEKIMVNKKYFRSSSIKMY